MPEEILKRHPFPGPGLAVRILGEITEERIRVFRQRIRIIDEELRLAETVSCCLASLPGSIANIQRWASWAMSVLTNSVLAIRAVTSTDGMTADWARFPHDTARKAFDALHLGNEGD